VINALHHGAHVFNLSLDGAEHQCFIKEVQYDYLGTNPVHLDLTRVDQNERVKVTVQVELRGVPKGVTQGGVLDQLISDVEVECPVMSIPELLRPRVNDLDVGESLHVRDLELPEGVVPVGDPDDVVCTVRALAEEVEEEADEGAEGTAGGSEPELIRKPKEEEEKSGD
jgi:large subunit ribosomal protein L25